MDSNVATPDRLREIPEALTPLRERVLASLVMIAQIPAPVGQESQRVRFLLARFAEAGLTDAAAEEVGNAVGKIHGKKGDRNILLVSHLDTIFPANLDHSVMVEADRVIAMEDGQIAVDGAPKQALMELERLEVRVPDATRC